MRKEKRWPVIWPGYETVAKLGAGSYGSVYKVRKVDESGEYYSAVKKISVPMNESEYYSLRADGRTGEEITSIFQSRLESIEDEFRLMEELKGDSHIVSYLEHMVVEREFDEFAGMDILIRMELLTSLADRYDYFSEKEVIRLGTHICAALETIERRGIIHRDIKPSNILYNSKLDYYKLADFGIAKVMDEQAAKGTMIGTVDYIAPEVYHKEEYGFPADQYSLGLVLYWALNGMKLPFVPLDRVPTDADLQEAKQRRLSGRDLPAPRYGGEELKSVVLRACAYKAGDRYPNITALRKALEACDGEADVTLFIKENAAEAPAEDGNIAGKVNDTPGEKEAPDTFEAGGGTIGRFSDKHVSEDETAGDDPDGGTIGRFGNKTKQDIVSDGEESASADDEDLHEKEIEVSDGEKPETENGKQETQEEKKSDPDGAKDKDTSTSKWLRMLHMSKKTAFTAIGGLVALIVLVIVIRNVPHPGAGSADTQASTITERPTSAPASAGISDSTDEMAVSSDEQSETSGGSVDSSPETESQEETISGESQGSSPEAESQEEIVSGEENTESSTESDIPANDETAVQEVTFSDWVPVLDSLDEMFAYNGKRLEDIEQDDVLAELDRSGLSYETEMSETLAARFRWWVCRTGQVTIYRTKDEGKLHLEWTVRYKKGSKVEEVNPYLPQSCKIRLGDTFEDVCEALGAGEMVSMLIERREFVREGYIRSSGDKYICKDDESDRSVYLKTFTGYGAEQDCSLVLQNNSFIYTFTFNDVDNNYGMPDHSLGSIKIEQID